MEIHIQIGAKRKRVLNSNENAHAGGRPSRGSGRLKRLRSASNSSEDRSTMDIDPPPRWAFSDDDSDVEEDEADEEDAENSSKRDLLTASYLACPDRIISR